MRKLQILLLISIALVQLSCSALQQTEFDRNRQLWRDSKITNYRMTIDLRKTGHATPNGKFIITVRGGAAESIKSVSNPESDLRNSEVKFGSYDTIDDIFQYIENADKEKWDWEIREIQYDSKLGYPKKVNLEAARVFDEEILFQVMQFEVLE